MVEPTHMRTVAQRVAGKPEADDLVDLPAVVGAFDIGQPCCRVRCPLSSKPILRREERRRIMSSRPQGVDQGFGNDKVPPVGEQRMRCRDDDASQNVTRAASPV